MPEEEIMSTVTATKTRTYDMAYIAIFAVLIAICSWISIPMTVPFTLQTFGVFMAVGVLGGKRGSLAVLVYILLGAIGVPVFAGFSGGFGILLNNTGGYIIGFLFSALAMWAIESLWGKKPVVQIISMVVGLLVCYAMGTIWFMVVYCSPHKLCACAFGTDAVYIHGKNLHLITFPKCSMIALILKVIIEIFVDKN